jgi:hypothetical protein
VQLNEHLANPDGDLVFRHARKRGWRASSPSGSGSRYRSVRTKDWLKFKTPDAPAVKREAEEDWEERR